ncbi:MAG TPA: amidohydrolase family protein, partial [Fimbriimonadaceae bacterium]|nr:amidohydrolase family protein [Fimbriimonadaceae bacterium]
VFDADAHVEESPETFADNYLDPEYRQRRPQVVLLEGGDPHWVIDQRIYPRRVGRGAHHFATPAAFGEVPSALTATKRNDLGSVTLADVDARLREMDGDGISEQVIFPTLFLGYPLTDDEEYATALCRSYNRWIKDVCDRRPDRLMWVCTVNPGDIDGAVAEVRRAAADGAVGCMILGTVGDRTLDDRALDPFYAALCDLDMGLAVHVGWSSPSLSGLYTNVYDALVLPFTVSMFTGFLHIVGGGVLDRFPQLRVAFFEAGCQWIPYLVERMEHYYDVGVGRGRWPVRAKQRPLDYARGGHVYFGFEVDEALLPHAISLVGEDHFIFASDIPHGDREWDSVTKLNARTDISEAAKRKLLDDNGRRFYGARLPRR